ncbi:hypothetical protein H2204_014336 [Knufia peltigerae]|uniref:Uncharacterized protein n=1 Tax=Knufia peltigerae TaxID=1002370 RepID=A0AA38XK40_9EURO|nr:hypothetical protein H2204_014336 [Knufia peltigerae]
MAPRRNAKSARRRLSSQPYRHSASGVTRAGTVFPRPLGRTITTLLEGPGIAIAGPNHGRLRLATESQSQSGLTKTHQAPTQENVDDTIDSGPRHEPRIRTDQTSETYLWLPSINSRSAPRTVEVILERINKYFEQWIDSNGVREPTTLFEDMTVITDWLHLMSSLPEEILNAAPIIQCLRKLTENYSTFVALWKSYSESLLSQRLHDLQIRVRRSPTSVPERTFSTLLVGIQSLSAYPALPSLFGNASEQLFPLLGRDVVVNVLRKCDELHDDFQNLTYKSERRTLWLHIWRCLKVAFVSFDSGDLSNITDRRCLEVEFFEKPGVAGEFKRLVRLPDAANPRSIENMVAKYCCFINRCRADPDERYFHLRRLQEEPLRKHVISSLRKFADSNILDSNTFPKLHFAVIRLNAINGGPAAVRRWRGAESARGDRLTPSSYISSPAASSFSVRAGRSSSAQGANVQKTSRRSTSTDTTSSTRKDADLLIAGQLGRRTSQRFFPQPRGINLTSDFDYVHCQFPETRALEVAHSEQISRELATPGIYSEGLRPEYLINRPPPHTRDSSSPSGSQYTRLFGPFGRLRSFIRRLIPGQSRALSPVALVSRKRRGERRPDGPRAIIDPKSRVRKTTPALRLRGGDGRNPTRGHSPRRETSANANASRAAIFRDQHISLFRQMFQERYRSIASPTDDEIWDLLERSAFRVGDAVALYNQPPTALRSAVTRNESLESADSSQFRRNSSPPRGQYVPTSPSTQRGASGRLTGSATRNVRQQAPTVRAEPGARIPHWQGPPQMPRMQDPFYVPQGNPIQIPQWQGPSYIPRGSILPHPTISAAPSYFGGAPSRRSPAATRILLGEITAGPELPDDHEGGVRPGGFGLRPRPGRQPLGELVVENDESAHGSGPEEGSSSDSSRHSSVNNTNQENQPPIDIHVDGLCHECPQFPGQYHHFCQCLPQPGHVHVPRTRRTTSPIESQSDEQNETEPAIEGNQDAQQAEQDPDAESEQDIDQRGPHRAARTLPHPNDEVPVPTLIPQDSHFRNVLRVIGSVHLPGLSTMLVDKTATHMRPAEVRAVIRDAFNNLRRETNELRAAYRTLLDQAVPIEMDRIPRREVPRLHPAHPATFALMRRELIDIQEQYLRILKMFDVIGRQSYLNLALRQGLNRFLRLMRNLRRLFLEYDHKIGQEEAAAQGSTPATPDSETDSQPFLSDQEQDRISKYNPRQTPSLPSRQDYAAMFRDELMREVTIQRQILEKSVRSDNRNQLIEKLMALDRQGNLGAGARYGYRSLNNDAAARGRPKGWNLEDAIAADIIRHRNIRQAERSNERRGRQKERRQKGLSVTKHWTGVARTNQPPFSAVAKGMSSEEEFDSSENDSTSSEDWP